MTLIELAALAGWGFVAILLLFWRAFIPEYLKEKGKNLATHEDINKIVDQVTAITQATKEIDPQCSSTVEDLKVRARLQKPWRRTGGATSLHATLEEAPPRESLLQNDLFLKHQ